MLDDYDPRTTAARPDLAAKYLEGKVKAARFVEGTTREVRDAQTPVCGQPSPEAFVKNFRCKFEEKTYNNTLFGQVIEEGGYTLDPSRTPKTVDFDIKTGNDRGKKQLGIYKLEGDKLTLVLTQAGSTTRPDSFKIEPGAPVLEVVLQRVKP